jgi:hypothetical protein
MLVANRNKILSQIMFISILVFFFFITGVYLYNIFSWRNYPDFGFHYRIATGYNIVAEVTKNGKEAGMQPGDRILTINNKSFSNFREFSAAMKRELGENNIYVMERGGKEIRLEITNVPIGVKKAFSTSGLSYLVGLCYVLIGILVFMMKPHQKDSWVFLLFATVFGLFLIFIERAGRVTPFWLENFEIFAYAFTPATFIHMSFSFPEERRILKKYNYLYLIPYLASIVLFLCIRSVTPTMGDAPSTLLIAAVVYMVIGVFFFLVSCLELRLTSDSEIVKLRSRIILLGFAITASIPLTDFVVNALLKVYIVPSSRYYLPFFVIFPLSIGYSIVKHDLFDFDAIIKRTYGYVLTTGTIAGIYVVFVFVSEILFKKIRGRPISLVFAGVYSGGGIFL